MSGGCMSGFKMSGNKSAEQIRQWGKSYWMESCFDRAALLQPCPMGATGACCKICHMGPCRFLKTTEERVEKGICGATLPTVVARNFLRMATSGAAAHTDLARDMAFTLLGVANRGIKDFKITDVKKLIKVAQILEIEFEGKDINKIARNVAKRLIDDFGRQTGVLSYIKRAPEKTRQRWKKWGIIPKGIDREITEAIHSSNIGVDHEPDNLLLSSLKVSLADGWGGSMISTDLSDILFGTPQPVMADAGFGIFKEDDVNLIIVGHEPSLAKKIMDLVSKPDIIEYAKSKDAKGINLGEIFIMRHGISNAGGFTNQELCIMTGIIDAVAVDVQCIMPTLVEVANNFHTKIITTSRKARSPGALHIQWDAQRAEEVAREIVMLAIDNYPNRSGMGERIAEKFPMMAGFSHEYFENINNSTSKASFRLLNNAIVKGSIRGLVGLVGCDNPRVQATGIHRFLVEELIMNDVLILSSECGSAACAASGFLDPETAFKKAGPGLKEVYETTGMPPILHIGACVDNSRMLTILSAMAAEGGLSDEIGGMPAVIIAPEWMAEKEIAVGCYFAASGVPVILGGTSPVKASEEISEIMTEVWFERFKGALHFEPDFEKILDLTYNYIDKAREELNLNKYEYRNTGVKDTDLYNEE
jgi:carbon-monoxide dehydrogenase catalytic subunit